MVPADTSQFDPNLIVQLATAHEYLSIWSNHSTRSEYLQLANSSRSFFSSSLES